VLARATSSRVAMMSCCHGEREDQDGKGHCDSCVQLGTASGGDRG